MKCPVDKSELRKVMYEEKVEIDQCDSCAGAWLDKEELDKIQEIKMNDYSSELSQIPVLVGDAYDFAKEKNSPEINCPKCDGLLERREYGYSSQILIDSCIQGHGVWLDQDELKALEIFYERSRLESADMKMGFLFSLREFLGI